MAISFAWASALLAVFVSVLVADRMGIFHGKNQFPVNGRTVVITGGSDGMGKSVAIQLAKKGANIVIVARTIAKLEAAIKEISASAINPSQRFLHISYDLTDPSSGSAIIKKVTEWNNASPPDILFCCAGASTPGLFIDTPPSTLRSQMDTNFFSSAYIAHAFLQPWLQRKPSSPRSKNDLAKHVVFTSSVAAFYPIAGYGPYSPSKSALRALSDTLSQELLLYDSYCTIRTHTIFPATIFTSGLDKENEVKPAITKKLEESDGGQTPDEVAIACIRGLERGEELVTTGLLGYAMKAAMLGSSKRNGWGIVDTILGWVVLVVMAVVRWDMDGTVKKWGKERLG